MSLEIIAHHKGSAAHSSFTYIPGSKKPTDTQLINSMLQNTKKEPTAVAEVACRGLPETVRGVLPGGGSSPGTMICCTRAVDSMITMPLSYLSYLVGLFFGNCMILVRAILH